MVVGSERSTPMPSMSDVLPGLAPWVLGCLLLAGTGGAWAQKYPGQTLSDPTLRVPPPPPRVAPYRQPSFAPPPPQGGAELDPQAQAQASQLPLDPVTANLQSRLPTDVPGTVRQLGLRVPNGSRIDMRGRPVTTPEVINALQH